jgi:hypothetical protein
VRGLAALALLAATAALAQAQEEGGQSHELIGQMGGRAAVLQLYETPRPDGSARLTGEYWILTPLLQRFLEGERSKQLGVTFLKEGNSPILYGRPGTATLQGTWSAGSYRGTRFAPGGQERERFEFQEKFPGMEGYSVEARCELAEGRYASSLDLAVEHGKLRRLDWRSRVTPSGHVCAVVAEEQQPLEGGLRFAAGRCRITLRELGDYVRASAENCGELCGSQAYLEPVLLDRRGGCQLMRPLQR